MLSLRHQLLSSALTVATIISLIPLAAPASSTPVDHQVVLAEHATILRDALISLRMKANAARADATTRTAASVSTGITDDALAPLLVSVTSSVTELAIPLRHEVQTTPAWSTNILAVTSIPAPYSTRSLYREINAASRITNARITTVTTAVTAWEGELAAEKARVAEQARLEAQRQATRIAPSHSTPAAPAGGESPSARIARLIASLPLSFNPVIIGECPETGPLSEACTTGDSSGGQVYTRITALGLRYSDCKLRMVLAHENRHQQQYRNHQITYDANGNISNVGWAEADANAFMRAYSC